MTKGTVSPADNKPIAPASEPITVDLQGLLREAYGWLDQMDASGDPPTAFRLADLRRRIRSALKAVSHG